MSHLDPHQRPPEGVRSVYKRYQKMKPQDLHADSDIVDPVQHTHAGLASKLRVVKDTGTEQLSQAFRTFVGDDASKDFDHLEPSAGLAAYEHHDMPGKALPAHGAPPNCSTSPYTCHRGLLPES
jgi:alkylated DNA repair protein alkB family protein 1